MTKRRKFNINGPFVSHALEMRRSPAWLHLSDTARRVLDRLEVEHMEHGGAENGTLICTYKDFEKIGIRRASISRAIRECVFLGFLEVTQKGGRAISDNRWPSLYRLTYVSGRGKRPDVSNEWQRIKTCAEAEAAVRAAAITRNDETQSPRVRRALQEARKAKIVAVPHEEGDSASSLRGRAEWWLGQSMNASWPQATPSPIPLMISEKTGA
jgi:DNA-binding FadR family transcriptional regulator